MLAAEPLPPVFSMDDASCPSVRGGRKVRDNNCIFPGETKHEVSLVVTGHVVYACQLSSSMALFTLESYRNDDDNNNSGGCGADTDSNVNRLVGTFDPWNNDDANGSRTSLDQEDGNLPKHVDIILKRKDGWEMDQINAIHKVLDEVLSDEHELAHVENMQQRQIFCVEGFPERMRPKFEGDTSPICLHAQLITVRGHDGSFFEAKTTAPKEAQNTTFISDVCTSKHEETPPSNSAPRSAKINGKANKRKGSRSGVDDRTRFSKFVQFLISEFGGYEYLSQQPVLDVAGGAGGLAFELCWRHGIDAMVVDTKKVKLTAKQGRFMKFRSECLEQLAKDPYGTSHKSLLKANLQNRFRSRDFEQLNTLLDSSAMLSSELEARHSLNDEQRKLH